jgi:hypothetical protein
VVAKVTKFKSLKRAKLRTIIAASKCSQSDESSPDEFLLVLAFHSPVSLPRRDCGREEKKYLQLDFLTIFSALPLR